MTNETLGFVYACALAVSFPLGLVVAALVGR